MAVTASAPEPGRESLTVREESGWSLFASGFHNEGHHGADRHTKIELGGSYYSTIIFHLGWGCNWSCPLLAFRRSIRVLLSAQRMLGKLSNCIASATSPLPVFGLPVVVHKILLEACVLWSWSAQGVLQPKFVVWFNIRSLADVLILDTTWYIPETMKYPLSFSTVYSLMPIRCQLVRSLLTAFHTKMSYKIPNQHQVYQSERYINLAVWPLSSQQPILYFAHYCFNT